MGWSAARKLRRGIDGLTRVLAIELLTAARGIELRLPLQPAPASAAVIAALRAAGAPASGAIAGSHPRSTSLSSWLPAGPPSRPSSR